MTEDRKTFSEIEQLLAEYHESWFPSFKSLGLEERLFKLMSKLTEETGEVAACINKEDGDIRLEVADVMIVCIQILHELGTSAQIEIQRAMKKNEDRIKAKRRELEK